ncbi:MAG: acetoacetate--CoA ligase [Candidatus Marinamargulisbacteria bacterium]
MMTKLWEPSSSDMNNSWMALFMKEVNRVHEKSLGSFSDLHAWSVQKPADFWALVASFLRIQFRVPPTRIMSDANEMLSVRWFEGGQLNYAENCLQNQTNDLAIYEVNESGLRNTLTRSELYALVSKWHYFFKAQGIKKGDRVAGILPNNLTALVAMLAATSLGAVWGSCSPDFGEQGICDRLAQIQPHAVISVANYCYKGKTIDIIDRLNQIKQQLSTTSLWINASDDPMDGWLSESDVHHYASGPIEFVPCAFQDPLFILFSSGTTGQPKCIVHSVGGTLLQHKKEHQLHANIDSNDTLFYYTTCGWMMWNWMVSALASQASLVLFDGVAMSLNASIWDLIDRYQITVFGCSASFIGASEKRNINLKHTLLDSPTRLILSTGSPLLPHHYDYIYSQCHSSLQLGSISGGTDIISCFALCNPLTPVYRGRLQGRGLGMDVVALNDAGQEVWDERGDLVCQQAMPAMPIYFLNDDQYKKYKDAYFKGGAVNQWFHGDYVSIGRDGSLEILGRSDATLNPGGVRIGTAEFYQILEHVPGIDDVLVSSVIVDNDEKIVLFIKLQAEQSLTAELKREIRLQLKNNASPRHMPQMIIQVSEIPYTKNGKKCEVKVKQILRGESVALQSATLMKAHSLNEYVQFAHQLQEG